LDFYEWARSREGGDIADEARAHLVRVSEPPPALVTEARPDSRDLARFFDNLNEAARQTPGRRVGRRLYMFLAGHGGDLEHGVERETVLLTADATPEAGNHFATRLWAAWVAAERFFEEILLIVDCCRRALPPIPLTQPTRRAAAPMGQPSTFAWVFSAPIGQKALERKDEEGIDRGVFTAKLLQGLKGEAADERGEVRVQRLFDWLEDNLAETPQTQVSPRRGDFLICAPRSAASHSLSTAQPSDVTRAGLPLRGGTLTFEAPIGVQIEAVDPNGEPITDWGRLVVFEARGGTWRVRGRAGKAIASRTVLHGNLSARHQLAVPVRPPQWTLDDVPGGLCIEGESDAEHPLAGWAVLDEDGGVVRALDEVESQAGRFAIGLDGLPAAVRLATRIGDARRLLSIRLVPGETTRLWLAYPDRDPLTALADCAIVIGADDEPVVAQLRETLRLHCRDGSKLPEEVLREALEAAAGDPVALLYVAVLGRQGHMSEIVTHATRGAAERLGLADPDVRALRGERVDLRINPRLLEGWRAMLAGQPRARTAGPAAGRRAASGPWLIWHDGEPTLWVPALADALWPGWDGESPPPPPETVAEDIAAIATDLTMPEIDALVQVKRPPVARLARHQRIAFIGATNDQLASSIVTAFFLRNRARWKRLEIFFLDDAPLGRISSRGRSGAHLLEARDLACAQLQHLLPHVAEEHVLYRYDEPWVFCSLWDIDEPHGIAHVSPYLWGADLGSTPSFDLQRSTHAKEIDALARALVALRARARLMKSDIDSDAADTR
jgi:hypothetical protein